MFRDLENDKKQEVYDTLAALLEADSEEYNKAGYTLYEISTAFDSYSEECAELYDTVNNKYADDYEIWTSGSIHDANVPTLSMYIIVLAVAILMVILFAMFNSWFEPVLFLGNIAIAVVINMGTNVFLPSIADTTN
ncbi:MAG: hypothetical protein ACI4JN_10835 [Ruminococcus sp.]